MIREYHLRTDTEGFYNITAMVREAVSESGVKSGACIVFCPHTTAGITINENSDPDVVTDLLFALRKTFPDRVEFLHAEGNTAAHLKAIALGSSVMIPVENSSLVLGIWQAVYFCEFDGPRNRTFTVKVLKE